MVVRAESRGLSAYAHHFLAGSAKALAEYLGPTLQFFTQYERFLVPSYMPGSHHNTSGWLQLSWNPELHLHR